MGGKVFNKKFNFIELLTFIQFLTTHILTLTPPKPHLFVTSNLQASIWNLPSKSRITEKIKAIRNIMIKKIKIFIFFALPTMLIVKGVYICYDLEIWTMEFFTQNLVKNFPFFGERFFDMIWVVDSSNLEAEAAHKVYSKILDLNLWSLVYTLVSMAKGFGELFYSDFELPARVPAGVGGESCEKKTPSPRGPLTLYKKGSDSGAAGDSDSDSSPSDRAKKKINENGASSGPNQDRLAPETDSEDETTQSDQGPRSRGYLKTRTRSMVRRRWIRDKPDWVEGLWTRSSTEGVENLDAQTKSAAENLDAAAAAIQGSQTPKSAAAENLDAAKGSKTKSAPKNLAITGSQAPKVKAALAGFLEVEKDQLRSTSIIRELVTKLEKDFPESLDFADKENGSKILGMLMLRDEALLGNNVFRSTTYKSLGQFMDPESQKNLNKILDKLEESRTLLFTEGQKHKGIFDRNSEQNTAYNFKLAMRNYVDLQNKVQLNQTKNFGLAESIVRNSIQREYKCKELTEYLREEFPTYYKDFNEQELRLKKYFLNLMNQTKN